MQYVAGVAAALVFWLICSVVTGQWNPLKLVEGHDERTSISKTQWLIWTTVIAFSYVTIFMARAISGEYGPFDSMPYNLWVVMGFSTGTMIAAKSTTGAYVAKGKITKSQSTGAKAGDLVKDDSGYPDLSKAQLLTWTLIAVGIYIVSVVHEVGQGTSATMPDISPTLMVLMGLSQGAYLGKKLATVTTPHITGLSPGAGPAGTTVRIIGLQFGKVQNGSMVTVDEKPIAVEIPGDNWTDTEVTFTLPRVNLQGTTEKLIRIGTIINSRESNAVPFTVTAA